jgi:hypothetical protein
MVFNKHKSKSLDKDKCLGTLIIRDYKSLWYRLFKKINNL